MSDSVGSNIFALGPIGATDFQVAAVGAYDGDWWIGDSGVQAIAVQARWSASSGSGGVRLCIQSSLDQGNNAYDVAIIDFAALSDWRLVSILMAQVAPAAPGVDGNDSTGSPASAGIKTAILGDRLKAHVILAGTYVNGLVSVRFMPIFGLTS